MGRLDTLDRAGIDVPVSIVGYDDSTLSRLAHVNVTTVSQHSQQQAEHAVAAAVERLDKSRVPAEVWQRGPLCGRGTAERPPVPAGLVLGTPVRSQHRRRVPGSSSPAGAHGRLRRHGARLPPIDAETPRPSTEQLAAARGRTIPDVLPGRGDPALGVLFCGINPGLYSAATGWHFARPGNRFWPALHLAGFTPRQLHPSEQHQLVWYGLGITNLVARATGKAAELDDEEFRAGSARLARLVRRHRPRVVAVAGVSAYRTGFGRPLAQVGRQDQALAGAALWVLPNPSGLNAHYSLPALIEEFARLREYVRHEGGWVPPRLGP